MKTRFRAATIVLMAGFALTLAISPFTTGATANAAGPTTVNLRSAAAFAVLAGTPAVTNTGTTTILGDVGIHPAAAVTGFPPGIVNGTIHAGDAIALQAKNSLLSAYNDAAGRTPATVVAGGNLGGGPALVGGVYNAGGFGLSVNGTLTLDGQNDPSSVWIFQATSTLNATATSVVALINGAQPCNVFWQVTSSATLSTGSSFVGTILANTSITMAAGVSLNGRALAMTGDVTLISDTITRSTCASVGGPALTPTVAATPSPTASPAPTAAPSAAPTTAATATPIGQTAVIISAAPSVASLPSTATADDNMFFLILPLLVIVFAVLYMLARARRRVRDPIV